MSQSKETPLLEVVTNQILDLQNLPTELNGVTPEAIEEAKKWIESQTRTIIAENPSYQIKDESLDDLAGFMVTDNNQSYLVVGQNWPTSTRISTLFHFLGHIQNKTAYEKASTKTPGGIAITYEYMNRRKLPMDNLKGEFAVDDLISRTVLANRGIIGNNAVARALYRSYLPFTQAKPFPPGHPLFHLNVTL